MILIGTMPLEEDLVFWQLPLQKLFKLIVNYTR